jgi:hypothetical protein
MILHMADHPPWTDPRVFSSSFLDSQLDLQVRWK